MMLKLIVVCVYNQYILYIIKLFLYFCNNLAKVCSSPPELFSSPPMNMRETIPFDTEDSFFYTKKSEAAKYLADNSQQMWKLGIASTLPPKDILNRFC